MALSAQDIEYITTAAELAATKAADKAVEKTLTIANDMVTKHANGCDARTVWKRVRKWLILLALVGGAGGGAGIITAITNAFTKAR